MYIHFCIYVRCIFYIYIYTYTHITLQISSLISLLLGFFVSQPLVISDFESEVPHFDEADITLLCLPLWLVFCLIEALPSLTPMSLTHRPIYSLILQSFYGIANHPRTFVNDPSLSAGKGHLVPRSQGSLFRGILKLFLLQRVRNFFSSNS